MTKFLYIIILLFIYIYKESETKVALSDFFPFGLNNSDESFVNLHGPSDDGSSEEINLNIPFPFFDELHNTLWVNVNGLISFLRRISTFIPICENVPQDYRMIAPFWADADLRRGGDIFYRQTFEKLTLNKAQTEIIKAFPWMKGFKAKWVFISTWYDVSFYGSDRCNVSRKSNTFQSILVTNGVQSFAIFFYNEITWTLGMASGTGNCDGNSDSNTAKVGFDAGDGKSFSTVEDSCRREIILIIEKSNYGYPGKWVFRVDNADIQSAGCINQFNGTIRFIPTFIDMFGHVPIEILGPCVDVSVKIICMFHDPVKGVVEVLGYTQGNETNRKLFCNAPFIYGKGRIKLNIVLSRENQVDDVFPGYISIISDEQSNFRVKLIQTKNKDLNLTFYWNSEDFNKKLYIKIFSYNPDLIEWKERIILAENIENTGRFSKLFDRKYFPIEMFDKVWSFCLQEDSTMKFTLSGIIDIYRYIWPNVESDCQAWYDDDDGPPVDLIPCPPTTELAGKDSRFTKDTECSSSPCSYHPGADFCILSKAPSLSGGGQECCYKGDKILLGPMGGGSVDKYHFINYIPHFNNDLMPWLRCCKNNDVESCAKYFEKRPSDPGTNYEPPDNGGGIGDPHITTFDHLEYTFNGAGDFWLIKNDINMSAVIQARMEPIFFEGESEKMATVFTAFVMKCGNSVTVQIQRSIIRKVDILIDGNIIELYDPVLFNVIDREVYISVSDNITSVSITFSCGISYNIQIREVLSIMVSCDNSFKGKTKGLLGVYDGNPDNDLQDPIGNFIESNSSIKEIHYKFGLKWRVSKEESLFFNANENNQNISLDFLPSFEEPNYDKAPEEAKDLCGRSKNCLFDYQITGSIQFAEQTKLDSDIFNETVEIFKKKIINCTPLSHPLNGYYQVENFFPESIAEYSCNKNFTLKGDRFVSCNENGIWNGTTPQCLKDEQDKPIGTTLTTQSSMSQSLSSQSPTNQSHTITTPSPSHSTDALKTSYFVLFVIIPVGLLLTIAI